MAFNKLFVPSFGVNTLGHELIFKNLRSVVYARSHSLNEIFANKANVMLHERETSLLNSKFYDARYAKNPLRRPFLNHSPSSLIPSLIDTGNAMVSSSLISIVDHTFLVIFSNSTRNA